MVKLGMVGLSEGNGHPFSFSAILNGYNEKFFSEVGWPVIFNYLIRRDISEIASYDARVTHVWTQKKQITEKLSKACLISNPVDNLYDMIGEVDALIIARDDFTLHLEMALPFLEKQIPVFIDKPLTLSLHDLSIFQPYLESGLLMSCSGFRFCAELDDWRQDTLRFGNVKLIQANVVNGWDKYGIHMLDAILGLNISQPLFAEAIPTSSHESVNIGMSDGSLFQINNLGGDIPVFALSVFGSKGHENYQLKDNFTAFRRTLFRFIEQVRSGKPSIKPESTILTIRTLIAGRRSLDLGARIYLDKLEGLT